MSFILQCNVKTCNKWNWFLTLHVFKSIYSSNKLQLKLIKTYLQMCSQIAWFYHRTMNSREGNIFSPVCLFTCYVVFTHDAFYLNIQGSPPWKSVQTHSLKNLHSAGDIWGPRLETCSKLYRRGHSIVLTSGGYRGTYSRQAGSMHHTGMLSYLSPWGIGPHHTRIPPWRHVQTCLLEESIVLASEARTFGGSGQHAPNWNAFSLPTAREGNVFTSVCHSVHNQPHAYLITAHPCGLLGHLLRCGRYASYWNA